MRKSIARELITNIVIFFVVIALCVAYLMFSVYHVSPGKKYTSVSMQLDNTYLIVPGTGVSMNGVKIGEVTSITPNQQGVLVKMKYAAKYDISATSKVEIGQQSAIGEPYVDFEPQVMGGPMLTNGSTVNAAQVSQPQSIPHIFDQLQILTTAFSAGPMAGLVNTMYEALDGTQNAMPALQNGAQLLMGVLTSRQATLRTMFANTQQYQSDMQWMANDLGAFGDTLGDAVVTFRNAFKGVSTLIYRDHLYHNVIDVINPFFTKLNAKLVTLWPNLVDTLTPFVPIAASINQTLPQIDVSALLSTALSMFGSDGAARLTVTLPPPKHFPPDITTTTRAPAR